MKLSVLKERFGIRERNLRRLGWQLVWATILLVSYVVFVLRGVAAA